MALASGLRQTLTESGLGYHTLGEWFAQLEAIDARIAAEETGDYTPVAVTATVGGLTTGLIPATAKYVTAGNGGTATFIITLPVPVVGHSVTIFNTNQLDLCTPATSNNTINGVDADNGAAQATLAAGSITRLTAVTATGWIAEHWIADGTPTKLVPA